MNPDNNRQLGAAIDRELKNLPDLQAPEALVGRVLRTLEERSRIPWYRRSWQVWPLALQAASFLALAALFAGLCFVAGKVAHADTTVLALRRAGDWYSTLAMVGNTLSALAASAVLVAQKLGTGFIVASLFAAGLAYALYLGLGTLYLRLALTTRREAQL
jgi:hypothetical protein